jgi:hypothetical protein
MIKKIQKLWTKNKEWNQWLEERNLKHKKNSPITGTFLKKEFKKQKS